MHDDLSKFLGVPSETTEDETAGGATSEKSVEVDKANKCKKFCGSNQLNISSPCMKVMQVVPVV